MSGWGNGEPENYTHIIPMPRDMCLFLLPFAHLAQFGTYVTNFVVMIEMLVFVTTTKMQLVEASQHHCHLMQCLLSPSSTLVECEDTNLMSAFLGGGEEGHGPPGDQWGHKSVPLGASSLKTLLLAPPSIFFLTFLFLLQRNRCCTSECIHLLLIVIYDHTTYRCIYLLMFIHSLLLSLPLLRGGIITSKKNNVLCEHQMHTLSN